VLATSVLISAIAIALPFSPIGRYLGFVPLPALYWPLLAATLACYVAVTQAVKMWLMRRNWLY
jgi:P-type Mg2+ transporter